MNKQKQHLKMALEMERGRFTKMGLNIFDHNLAIMYLSNGALPENWRKYNLFITKGVVDDFDSVYDEYIVKPNKFLYENLR